MATLIYSMLASLDGYVEDAAGRFDWAAPGDEVHRFVNELERRVGTHLYGRRMYETMVYWEAPANLASGPPYIQEYAAIWQAAEKVVYSRTLTAVSSARTRIEREFDVEAVRHLKDEATGELSIGGPDLAGKAIAAGLVDEYQLFLVPVLVGGGKRALPDGVRADLDLVEQRLFAGGTVYLRFRTRAAS